MIIYLVENVSQKPRNSLMRGRVRCMLRYQVPRLFRCKFRKKMQEKQEECEIIILRTQKLVSDLKSQLKKSMGVWIDRIKRKILLIIFL